MTPLDGAYLADFGIDVTLDQRRQRAVTVINVSKKD